jgi:hypothetical protein
MGFEENRCKLSEQTTFEPASNKDSEIQNSPNFLNLGFQLYTDMLNLKSEIPFFPDSLDIDYNKYQPLLGSKH